LQNDIRQDGGRIAINPDRFDKLTTALRTAVDNDGILDKEYIHLTTYFMLLDWHSSFIISEIGVNIVELDN
jgi:hypothetical protein